ncbi:MAG: Magnesium and cobalt efflux protein CorC [Chlamydiae bacterium]|nr:Magnesium and cobalt efflux protein CorC [Chlamydiota bacterium]
MIYLLIVILILLILGSALFSSSETALFSLSSMQIQAFGKSKNRKKELVTRLLASPRDLLITLIMLNVILNIFVQNVVSNIFGVLSGWWVNVGVPLALTLIFGEFIPKSIGIANNVRWAPRVAPLVSKVNKCVLPIRSPLIRFTSVISRILFFFLKDEKEVSTDELQHALRTSRARGVLAEDEAELMRGYLNLQESTAKGFQRPREEALLFDIGEPISKLIHLFVDQECTRIPVYENKMDNIIGIMSSGQFFLHRESLTESKDLLPLLKKPFFIPETTSAQILLDQMYEKQESLAIVVDEYGAFSGLISLEDLVEAVVGEIFDRRDEKSRYTRSGDDVIIASGKLEIMELESLFDITLTSQHNMVTLGGWLIEQFGEIPKSGTKHTYKNFLFHVLSSDEKRVRRVYIRRLSR